MAPHEITIDAVARESGVSRATIYRCDTLYAMVQKANPKLRRREAEQKIREDHERSQAQVAAAVQMKKKILALQHENARLTELLAYCTCESKHLGVPHPAEG